jgi:hypothetical protein
MMSSKSDSVEEATSSSRKTLVRSNATCGDDDTNLRSVRLVTSQTKPALSSSVSKGLKTLNVNSIKFLPILESTTFTDATDTDLLSFIVQTLHKNPKDRALIFHIEKVIVDLLQDLSRRSVAFEPMSSYDRMIVHRVAAYFGCDHNISQEGTFVVVSKTEQSQM